MATKEDLGDQHALQVGGALSARRRTGADLDPQKAPNSGRGELAVGGSDDPAELGSLVFYGAGLSEWCHLTPTSW